MDDLISEAQKLPPINRPQGIIESFQAGPPMPRELPVIRPTTQVQQLQSPTLQAPTQTITPPTMQAKPVQAQQQVQAPKPVQVPTTQIQAPTLQAPPTLEQFQAPAKQTFSAILEANRPQLERNIETMARKIFGQNVGAESSIGRENVQRLLEDQAAFFAPTLEKLSAEASQQFLESQRINTERVFDLVQQGHITGDQATRGLQAVGINPENFQTSEQLQDARDKKTLDEFKEQFGPESQELADTIDTIEEARFFERTGKTIEQNILDIIEEAKTEEKFKARLPELRTLKSEAENMLNKEASRTPGLFGFPPTVEELEKSVAAAQLRLDQINELIASRGRD